MPCQATCANGYFIPGELSVFPHHIHRFNSEGVRFKCHLFLSGSEYSPSLILKKPYQERESGLLFQWHCNSSCTSWCDTSICKYFVFCAVNSPSCICYMYTPHELCKLPICVSPQFSYSRHMMELKNPFLWVIILHVFS